MGGHVKEIGLIAWICACSQAREEDLTPEYREERDQLLRHIKGGLVPKEKNGKGSWISMLTHCYIRTQASVCV